MRRGNRAIHGSTIWLTPGIRHYSELLNLSLKIAYKEYDDLS